MISLAQRLRRLHLKTPPLTARYVRLLIASSLNTAGNPNNTTIYEMQLFESLNAEGADLTTGKVASASTQWSGASPYKAIDDNIDSYWQVYNTPILNHWIKVDLGVAEDIKSMTLFSIGLAQSYHVQTSDNNVDWVTVTTIYPTNSSETQIFNLV